MNLGKGLTLRRAMLPEILQNSPSGLDWAEVVAENFMNRGGQTLRNLEQVAERIPVTLHGVSLSIGSIDPLDRDYLKHLRKLAQQIRAPWFTDHLSYSSVNGVQLHNLLPLPFNEEAINHVVERIHQVQDYLEIPFGLENPSYYAIMPGSEMTEAQFLKEVLERSGCSLLLDINNVYVNSFNLTPNPAQSALDFIKKIPLHKIIEVHIAGHRPIQRNGVKQLLDTHGAPVSKPVLRLLQELHRLRPVQTLLLERENQIPPLHTLLQEITQIWTSLQRPTSLQPSLQA